MSFKLKLYSLASIVASLTAPTLAWAQFQDSLPVPGYHMVGSWGASPGSLYQTTTTPVFSQNTVRVIGHVSLGTDNVVQVRLSNAQSDAAITFSDVHIAKWAGSASHVVSDIVPGTDQILTFNSGAGSVTIPAGGEVVSDVLYFPVSSGTDVAVTVYVPNNTTQCTLHVFADGTSFWAAGDVSGATTMANSYTYGGRPFLTGIQVGAPSKSSAIVVLGDSITDGVNATSDGNTRWPDDLSRRLQATYGNQLGMINAGISGNFLLSDAPTSLLGSQGGLHRLNRDVLAVPGVKYLIVADGINDIFALSGVTAAQVIAGQRSVIARAHDHGIYVYGATITPAGQAAGSTQEQVRQAVNTFIRTSHAFDGVIDFDAVIADQSNPGHMLSSFNGGDGIHPNNLGYQAMANAVSLALFDPSKH